MPDYQLKIKQVIDYPRCRIYRQFIQSLIEDSSIRVKRTSYLYFYVVLSTHANFRTSYRRLDGFTYTVFPGEWICTQVEIKKWFRCRSSADVLHILDHLQKEPGYINFTILGRGSIIKYTIIGWEKNNAIIDHHAPCAKTTGFFFLCFRRLTELTSMGKCAEKDILLDCWFNAVYNDFRIISSDKAPVVYFRNHSNRPVLSYAELADRWGISKATVSRVLNKLSEQGHITVISFSGTSGSAIYLNQYASTMFQVSDTMIDKQELALTLNLRLPSRLKEDCIVTENQIIVSEKMASVSKCRLAAICSHLAKILAAQGLSCCHCSQAQYKLSLLSLDCNGTTQSQAENDSETIYNLSICCGRNVGPQYHFLLKIKKIDSITKMEV